MSPSRRLIALAPALVFLTLPALAQKGPRVDPVAVVAAVTADWNDDGIPDRAVLVADESEPDLLDLHVALSRDGEPLAAREVADSIAWQGMMAGQEASLVLAPNGSLRLVSQNTSIGRDRWERTLTIAHRDGRLVVAGFTHVSYDTLDPDAATSCDVNLLTGRGVRDELPITLPAGPVAIEEWTLDTTPAPCDLDG